RSQVGWASRQACSMLAMPLDPQVRTYLESLAGAELPYPHGYEAPEARVKMREDAPGMFGAVEDVDAVIDPDPDLSPGS
ncbi:MAG: hypothetical protein ACE5EV_09090, partial [Gaiellales bacterium]